MPDEAEKVTTHRANRPAAARDDRTCLYGSHEISHEVVYALREQAEEFDRLHDRIKGVALLVVLAAVWVALAVKTAP